MWRRVGPAVRALGFVALAVFAVAQFYAWQPDGPGGEPLRAEPSESLSQAGAISAALAGGELNESSADSAPQQQVVNGWVARDLLAAIGRQNEEAAAARDTSTRNQAAQFEVQSDSFDRLSALGLATVLAIAWHGLTLPLIRPRNSGMRWSPLAEPPPPLSSIARAPQ